MSNLKEILPVIVFAVYFSDLGDNGVTWEYCADGWEKYWKPSLTQKHSGDCTNECHSCSRCQAEDCVRIAAIIEEGLNK